MTTSSLSYYRRNVTMRHGQALPWLQLPLEKLVPANGRSSGLALPSRVLI